MCGLRSEGRRSPSWESENDMKPELTLSLGTAGARAAVVVATVDGVVRAVDSVCGLWFPCAVGCVI